MSYSIGPVRGATKYAAMTAIAAEFDAKVLPHQPQHARDRGIHLAAMELQMDLISEPGEGQEVELSMNGWLSMGTHPATGSSIPVGGGCGVSASLVTKKA